MLLDGKGIGMPPRGLGFELKQIIYMKFVRGHVIYTEHVHCTCMVVDRV
jgi:D-serine dehydratase